MFTRLFQDADTVQTVLLALAPTLVVAYLIAESAARLTRAVFLKLGGEDGGVDFKAPIVRTPIRVMRVMVFLAVAAVLAPPALELAGLDLTIGLNVATLTAWFMETGLRIVLIAVVAFVFTRLVGILISRFEYHLSQGTGVDVLERAKRAKTLGTLVRNVVGALVFAAASLMILQQLDVNITPVLTGAGIIGLAAGFGGQTLVKDIISGFFLILENQVRVGDVASINGTGGLVEAINLRTIVLRDLSGRVHVFPNGSVDTLSNLTKDFSYYVIDMGVAYKEDTDEVVKVLKNVAATLQEDPAYAPNILAPLEVLGVDSFDDSQVTIKIRLKTAPLKQWEVGRELRRRIKKTFDACGIEIPFPHRSVYFGEASKPWLVRPLERTESGEAA